MRVGCTAIVSHRIQIFAPKVTTWKWQIDEDSLFLCYKRTKGISLQISIHFKLRVAVSKSSFAHQTLVSIDFIYFMHRRNKYDFQEFAQKVVIPVTKA